MPRGAPEGTRRTGALGGGGAKGAGSGGGSAGRMYGVKTGAKGQASRATPRGTSSAKSASRPSVKNPQRSNPQGSPYRPNTPSSQTSTTKSKPASTSKAVSAAKGAQAKVRGMDATSKKGFKALGAVAAAAGFGGAMAMGNKVARERQSGPPPKPWAVGQTAVIQGRKARYDGNNWVAVK